MQIIVLILAKIYYHMEISSRIYVHFPIKKIGFVLPCLDLWERKRTILPRECASVLKARSMESFQDVHSIIVYFSNIHTQTLFNKPLLFC